MAEALTMIPGDERKDYEFFLTYHAKHDPEIDIAWSDAFVGASAWLADREKSRIEQAKKEANGNSFSSGPNFSNRL